jgi:hypothetical protein
MTPEETFGQLLGIGIVWLVAEVGLEERCSVFQLWPQESKSDDSPVVCLDHIELMQKRH